MDLDATPWIARLKALAPLLKQRVDGAAEFAAVKRDSVPRTPCAWVIPGSETGGSNDLDNAYSQEVVEEFVVVTAIRNVRDGTGEAAHDDLTAVRREQKQALINWQPDEEHAPAEYKGGRLLMFGNGLLYWADRYRTAYEERRV